MGKRIFEEIKIYCGYLLDIIFPIPEFCTTCGRELKEYNKFKLCNRCLGYVIYYNDGGNIIIGNEAQGVAYDNTIIACSYEGLVRELIHAIKYKDKRECAITIAAILSHTLEEISSNYDFIVPVPISSRKLKKRGYNHMKLVAIQLSQHIKIPVSDCLIRVKDTKPQVLFNAQDRWYNVEGCFKCAQPLVDKEILLLDDIITSGATAHFCAEELKKAGAKSVTVLSFAKSNLQ